MEGSAHPGRIRIIRIILLVFVVVLVVNYAAAMLFPSQSAAGGGIAMPDIERGPILDRNGRILAISTRLYSLSAWMPDVRDAQGIADSLAPILSIPRDVLLDKLTSSSGSVFIKRKLSPTEYSKTKEWMASAKPAGLALLPEMGRSYPEQTLGCYILGHVDIDNAGKNGVEYTFNDVLSPPVIGDDTSKVYGNQVFLSIDLRIQYELEKIAKRTFSEHSAKSVMLLVADAQSGELLGAATQPGYDPNRFNTYDPAVFRNKFVSMTYEPGSVFKVFSVAAALQSGSARLDSDYSCDGSYDYHPPGGGEGFTIGCLGVHGRITTSDILRLSCNVGAATAVEAMSTDDFSHILRGFGFGSKTGIALNGEEHGFLRPTRDWSQRSKPTIAIGQEISVTAVQIIRAATALANDGWMLEPLIVQKILAPDGSLLREFTRTPVSQVIRPEHARSVLQMMQGATAEGGTATRARIDGINVSAKTGTAQMIDPRTGRYSDTIHVASCLALFPSEKPRIIVYVVLEGPQGESYFGGRIAAPVVAEIGNFLVNYLAIPRQGQSVTRPQPGTLLGTPAPLPLPDTTIPDYSGFSKRQLLPLLLRDDMIVQLTGSGWVRRQDPPPGTPFRRGMVLKLELE